MRAAHIPSVKGISEKFRRIGYEYVMKSVFKTRQTLCTMLTGIRPHREVYSTPVNLIGVTSETQENRLVHGKERSLKHVLMEKYRLAKHVYKKEHCIEWKKAKAV
jgi:hypothetical protein